MLKNNSPRPSAVNSLSHRVITERGPVNFTAKGAEFRKGMQKLNTPLRSSASSAVNSSYKFRRLDRYPGL
jgi:hypothetical protein